MDTLFQAFNLAYQQTGDTVVLVLAVVVLGASLLTWLENRS